ncbi:MAG: division plane positioning ATPase MipZ, partial [Bacteroidota bacterium]
VSQFKADSKDAAMAAGNLAAKLLARSDAKTFRFVTFASTAAGTGKSLLASEFAGALAAMGRKVALLDLDLHKADATKGLSNAIIAGQTPRPLHQANGVHFFPAGNAAQYPGVVLNHTRFNAWWQDLSNEFDVVVVDTPACNKATETYPILQNSDMVLWLSRNGVSAQDDAMQPDLLALEYGIGPFLHVYNHGKAPNKYLQLLSKLLPRGRKSTAVFTPETLNA